MTYLDKLVHIGCGAVAALVGSLAFGLLFNGCTYWQVFICGFLCACAAGIAAEVKDMAYHRMCIVFFDLFDLLATIIGGAIGAVAGAMLV